MREINMCQQALCATHVKIPVNGPRIHALKTITTKTTLIFQLSLSCFALCVRL